MDSIDKDGNEVFSEDEDDEEYGDEEDYGDEDEEIDEETLKKLREEAAARGEELEYDDEEYDEEEGDYDEEEEEEEGDEEDEDDQATGKRGHPENGDGAASKRKK